MNLVISLFGNFLRRVLLQNSRTISTLHYLKKKRTAEKSEEIEIVFWSKWFYFLHWRDQSLEWSFMTSVKHGTTTIVSCQWTIFGTKKIVFYDKDNIVSVTNKIRNVKSRLKIVFVFIRWKLLFGYCKFRWVNFHLACWNECHSIQS